MEMTKHSAMTREGVYISTYGCQMNVNDTERMHALLEMINYEPVGRPEDANLIIINACSVREKPVHKVRSEVGKYRKLKTDKPQLRIGVGGCVGQQEKGQLLKDIPLLDFVFGTDAIDQLPQIVQKVRVSDQPVVEAKFKHNEPYQIETLVKNPGVSTFVNITKGCDNFCSFCIVPFTRGRERSREMSSVIEDIQRLVKRGVKEVTLLGQNVNSYKSSCGASFTKLLEEVVAKTDVKRLRYTSPHPKDYDTDVADVMAKYADVLMPCVHMPLQSGDTEILERMNRGYTREEFLTTANMMKERIPGVVLTTDIIVGFPGETEEQFQNTMKMLDEVHFDQVFAFKYSPRPYTKAAKYEDQLTEAEKSDRLNRLFAKHKEISLALAQDYVGKTLDVLVEEFHPHRGKCFGRSPENKSVHFEGSDKFIGQIVKVHIEEAFSQSLYGKIVQ